MIYIFLIPEVIAKFVKPIAELSVLIGIPSKETEAEIEIHTVIGEDKIRKC